MDKHVIQCQTSEDEKEGNGKAMLMIFGKSGHFDVALSGKHTKRKRTVGNISIKMDQQTAS